MIDKETANKLLEMNIDDMQSALDKIEDEQQAFVYIPVPPNYDPKDDISLE